MHYKNGREAKNGDVIVQLNGTFSKVGVLHSATGTSDTCNGRLARVTDQDPYINIKDCLHIEDVRSADIGPAAG